MESGEEVYQMAVRYWELSNELTAFAIVQMIGLVLTASSQVEFRKAIRKNWLLTIGLIAVGTAVYVVALEHCYQMEILASPRHKIFEFTSYSRMALVIAANLVGTLWVAKLKTE